MAEQRIPIGNVIGPEGKEGTLIFPITTATPNAPTGARIKDKILNSGASNYVVGNITMTIGALAEITSINPFQLASKGNIRGLQGPQGYPGERGPRGYDGATGDINFKRGFDIDNGDKSTIELVNYPDNENATDGYTPYDSDMEGIITLPDGAIPLFIGMSGDEHWQDYSLFCNFDVNGYAWWETLITNPLTTRGNIRFRFQWYLDRQEIRIGIYWQKVPDDDENWFIEDWQTYEDTLLVAYIME